MCEFEITKAEIDEIPLIEEIVSATIKEIYSKYYPEEVVTFFLELHNTESIKKDVLAKKTYVIQRENILVGTATVDENHVKTNEALKKLYNTKDQRKFDGIFNSSYSTWS